MPDLVAIAARLDKCVAALTLLSAELRSYGATPVTPTPPIVEPTPTPVLLLDQRLAARGVTVHGTGARFTLEAARYMEGNEAGGRHHILVDVRDSAGHRIEGATLTVKWQDGSEALVTEAKPGEQWAAAFPMYAAGNGYSLLFDGWEISGMGLGTIAQPHVGHHVCYGFKFRKE